MLQIDAKYELQLSASIVCLYVSAAVAYKSRYNSIIAVSQSNHHHHKHDCHHRWSYYSRLRMRADKEGRQRERERERESNLLLLLVSPCLHHFPSRHGTKRHGLPPPSFSLFPLVSSILFKVIQSISITSIILERANGDGGRRPTHPHPSMYAIIS